MPRPGFARNFAGITRHLQKVPVVGEVIQVLLARQAVDEDTEAQAQALPRLDDFFLLLSPAKVLIGKGIGRGKSVIP